MKNKENETVTMSLTEYNELVEKICKLAALEAAGVDNWVGYGDAMDMMESDSYES
jgi:hypothetical protein